MDCPREYCAEQEAGHRAIPEIGNHRGKGLALAKRFRCPGNQLQRREKQSDPHEYASVLLHIARLALQKCSAACDKLERHQPGKVE